MTSLTERLHLEYTVFQLFDLVADVERYPEFLPWVVAADVRRRENQTVWVDMTFGTIFLRKQVSIVALLDRPRRIDISSHDPLFDCFEQSWNFEPTPGGGTNVEYYVDLQLRSPLLRTLIGTLFADGASAMVTAYRRRAQQLYGGPS